MNQEPCGAAKYFDFALSEHAEVLASTREHVAEPFVKLVTECVGAIQKEKKLLFFGNGGSASDAQHIATELVVRFESARLPIPAIALTTDTSTLTAIGNDFGFENIFSRQLEAVCLPGDVAIGISTSGNSENVIRGLKTAKQIGAVTRW